jgi:SAM-dependent methyltransferase
MYGHHPIQDLTRVVRAWTTNQVARFAPAAYLRLTEQTGRGKRQVETPQSVAGYFLSCFEEYFQVLQVERADIPAYLRGKIVLEYGPGNVPGVALLMFAYGAERVICVDRFPLLSFSEQNSRTLDALLERLPEAIRRRAETALRRVDGRVFSFDPGAITYLVRKSGLAGLPGSVDLVISRAVLEHVDDLPATFADMEASLRAQGTAIHLVDLRSHGMHQENPLDFLSWPPALWRIMHSHKGVPNRWRVTHYREVLKQGRLSVQRLSPTAHAAVSDVAAVRPHLARPFQAISDEELAWLGFWLVCRK